MRAPRVAVRLLSRRELGDDPAECIELHVDDAEDGSVTVRLTPLDLALLHMETTQFLERMRATVVDAALAEEERRQEVLSTQPDVTLLQRVLDGLRNDYFVPA